MPPSELVQLQQDNAKLTFQVGGLRAENERLRVNQTEALKRLAGADYDLGRAVADGEADNDRVRDAWQGVREARALLSEGGPEGSSQ